MITEGQRHQVICLRPHGPEVAELVFKPSLLTTVSCFWQHSGLTQGGTSRKCPNQMETPAQLKTRVFPPSYPAQSGAGGRLWVTWAASFSPAKRQLSANQSPGTGFVEAEPSMVASGPGGLTKLGPSSINLLSLPVVISLPAACWPKLAPDSHCLPWPPLKMLSARWRRTLERTWRGGSEELGGVVRRGVLGSGSGVVGKGSPSNHRLTWSQSRQACPQNQRACLPVDVSSCSFLLRQQGLLIHTL